jgi:hypothetical protein
MFFEVPWQNYMANQCFTNKPFIII